MGFERHFEKYNRFCNRRMLYFPYNNEEGGDSWMLNRMRGDEFRTTLVCVDSYEDAILAGRLYNPYLSGGACFQSLMQFLLKMEGLLDNMQFPQPFMASRAFTQPPDRIIQSPPATETQEGKLATFAVRVIFRQNASWQGSVTWLEGGREESFRSVLELALLMDSAMQPTVVEKQKRAPASPSCGA